MWSVVWQVIRITTWRQRCTVVDVDDEEAGFLVRQGCTKIDCRCQISEGTQLRKAWIIPTLGE